MLVSCCLPLSNSSWLCWQLGSHGSHGRPQAATREPPGANNIHEVVSPKQIPHPNLKFSLSRTLGKHKGAFSLCTQTLCLPMSDKHSRKDILHCSCSISLSLLNSVCCSARRWDSQAWVSIFGHVSVTNPALIQYIHSDLICLFILETCLSSILLSPKLSPRRI